MLNSIYSFENQQSELQSVFIDMRSIAMVVGLLLSWCQTGEETREVKNIPWIINIPECKVAPEVKNEAIKIMFAWSCNTIEWPLPEYNPLDLKLRWPIQELSWINYDPNNQTNIINDVRNRVESLRTYNNWEWISIEVFENNGIKFTYTPPID